MKKLVIVIGIACAAVFAHGASVNWSVARNATDMTKGNTVYAFLASDSAKVLTAIGAISSYTQSGFESALGTAGVSYSGGYSSGVGNATRGNVTGILTDANIADSSDIAMMLVVFDSSGNYSTIDGVTGHSYSATTQSGAVSADFGSAAFTGATWTALGGGGGGGGGGTIPEPTSGLLLALGGAMLALRRKRA